MIKQEIAALVQAAIDAARRSGALADVPPADITIDRPQRPEHGDYATNVALRIARAARSSPLDVARTIADKVPAHAAIETVEAAPPGFVNFRLSPGWLTSQVAWIVEAGPGFGSIEGQPSRK